MTILIDNASFTLDISTGLPLIDFRTRLFAGLDDIWLPDAANLTRDGSNKVSAWASSKPSGGRTLQQAVANSQPTWVDNQLNGYPVMRFTSGTGRPPNRFLVSDFPAASNKSWTKIMVVKAAAVNGSPTLPTVTLWNHDATVPGTNGHQLDLAWSGSAEQVLARGGAGNPLSVSFNNRPIDAWFVIENDYDHTTQKMGLAINGSAYTIAAGTGVVDAVSTGIGGSPNAGNGLGANADIAVIALANVAYSNAANLTARNLMKTFIRRRTGLTIA